MKLIGLIGGMSWESTRIYYELLNKGMQQRLGGYHSARVLLTSVDFAPIAAMQMENRWDEAGEVLGEEAARLERAGAEIIAMTTNTMHKVAPQMMQKIGIPLLHIADPLAQRMKRDGCSRPLLLATRFTMEQSFLRERLAAQGIATMVPSPAGRACVHDIIYNELCKGMVNDSSRQRVVELIDAAAQEGADSVILGCTEICMLIRPQDARLALYDTTVLHAAALVSWSLGLPE